MKRFFIASAIRPVPTIMIKYSKTKDFFPFASFIFRLRFLLFHLSAAPLLHHCAVFFFL